MTREGSPPRNLEREARENLERLRENPYPGRGIVIGEGPTGDIVHVNFLMGRGYSSRNRVFVREADSVRTDLFDKTNPGDTSNRLYTAMRRHRDIHILSNGDQTDTIADFLVTDPVEGFRRALETRTYEPDDPNTPRISGRSRTYRIGDEQGVVTRVASELSIIRKGDGDGGNPERGFFPLKSVPGIGYIIHTYETDGEPLPSFKGNPYPVPLGATIDETANMFWEALNEDNKVAIVVKQIHVRSGEVDYRIINKLAPSSA